uniref:Corticotropin releasing hormone receptor 2 n=1 Tax=Hucho hucho TaxID=62062 RepID=A0A4W5Q566_9TELE
MDATIYQIIFGEFGDPNCSVMDSFQDSFYENASFSLMDFDGLYCNATTDEIGTCWPKSNTGRIVERPCPEYINGVKYNTTRSAYRECIDNGTWALKSNYSSCEPILEEKRKYPMHYKIALIINYLGHCISVGALVVAFVLFLCLRSIRCLRNIIHWNLITTFILRNVMWFLLQLIDHNIHESNEPWCRLITTIYNYFVVTNFFWMFVEGCYLHTAIVMTYSTDKLKKWVFLFIGWCIPCPIIVAWAIGKLYNENEQCWFGKEPGKYIDYIYQGPVILVLLVRPLSLTVLFISCPNATATNFTSFSYFFITKTSCNELLMKVFHLYSLLDKLRFPLQHSKNPYDQVESFYHIRNYTVQQTGYVTEWERGMGLSKNVITTDYPYLKSSKSDISATASAGDHLHAVFCESRGRRHLANSFYLFQFISTIISGVLCVSILLLS